LKQSKREAFATIDDEHAREYTVEELYDRIVSGHLVTDEDRVENDCRRFIDRVLGG
jgi:hypothetical protein